MAYTKDQWERWKREHPSAWRRRAEKIANARKGSKLSKEHREAISRAMSGRKLAVGHREKISHRIRSLSTIAEAKHKLVISLTLILFFILIFDASTIGFFAIPQLADQYESFKEINADSSVELLRMHVDLGFYRSPDCADNIYVATERGPIDFITENPVYDNNGNCQAADVVFKNIIYDPDRKRPVIPTEGGGVPSITPPSQGGEIPGQGQGPPETPPAGPPETPPGQEQRSGAQQPWDLGTRWLFQ